MTENYNIYKEMIENRLKDLCLSYIKNEKLYNSMFYSLQAGGKRLRPVFNIMAAKLLNGDIEETLDIACAIEMIHTYSLIHDDLPAMDNDELRRGKPTNHIIFGEAQAILAGDGLLNIAFEIMLENACKYQSNIFNHVKSMKCIANAAGVNGMICGQTADIDNTGQILSLEDINYICENKTGAMITGSLLSGLLLNNPSDKQYNALKLYGDNVGITFQIIDDILDIIGTEKELGKSIGKDKKESKFTYPVLFGIDKSRQIAIQKTEEAIESISVFGNNAKELIELSKIILNRKN